METISIAMDSSNAQKYNVFIEKGLLNSTSAMLKKVCSNNRILLIVDEIAYVHHGNKIALPDEYNVDIFTIKQPENSKKLCILEKITTWALEKNFDRHSLVICFGGGAVGDIGGFFASVYMRGIPFIQIPTTLLAQVDASVGGKTAVNLGFAKNIIGTFHQPKAVFIDPNILKTLPKKEFLAGLAESIKMAILADENLFYMLEKSNLSPDMSELQEVIIRSVQIKAKIVAKDEREQNCRILLNLGHTTAHAIEAATNYKVYLHGEAVAFGCIVAAFLSEEIGFLDTKSKNRIVKIFQRLLNKCNFSDLNPESIISFTKYDKKRIKNIIRFVLPKKIGQAFVYEDISTDSFINAFQNTQKILK